MEFLIPLTFISGIGSLICFIIVLTKLFPAEGVGKGFLGIICGLYTFIWGWQNKDLHDIQTVMTIWSVLFGFGLIFNIIMTSAGY